MYDCNCNFLLLSPNHPSDQLRPAHLLIVWLPVARLPVLPPQTTAEGKGGPRQAGRRTGDGGTQPHRGQRLQTSQQRPHCCGGLERRDWAEDRDNFRIYFCMCLQNEHQQSIHAYMVFVLIFPVLFLFVASAHFTHHGPDHRANRFPVFCYDSDIGLKILAIWGRASVIIICCCLFILV